MGASARLALFADVTEHGRSRATPLLAALAIGLGVALVVLSAPRIVAELYAVPAVAVIDALDNNRLARPTPADLVAAQQGLGMAWVWQQDATLAVERARIDLILVIRQMQNGQNARPLLDQTIAAARQGLHGAPAQARGWLILAEATAARDGIDAPHVTDYLAESLRASPYDVWMAPNRVWLALQLWDRLDAPTRALAATQIQLAIRNFGVERMVQMARQLGAPEPVRQALMGDPELRRRFEALYLQL
jgi:hypothetical protein